MSRPIYTPPGKIKTSLYARSKELMAIKTNIEYIGLYHQYPNGALYSEAQFNEQSVELISFVPAMDTEFGGIYYSLTKKRFNNYIEPKYYRPMLNNSDYTAASILRFFVQSRNNLSHIIEIDADSYANMNNKNEAGIDAGIYHKTSIAWSIAGPKSDVMKANHRVVLNSKMIGLSNHLTQLTEFYR